MSKLFPENMLTLCIDFSSLSGYVALSGTRRLVDECQLELNWIPVIKLTSRSAGKIQADDPLAEYKARRARARKMFSERELERDCALLDISIEGGKTQYDHTYAACGLLLLREADANQHQYWQYVEAVYSAAFREQHPIDSANKAAELVESSGFPSSQIDNMSVRLKDMQEELLEAGVFDSPTFVYEGERFLGRQHLPLLTWMLKGRQGTPPV
jgi:2-hydroxychromene-2-carboxylate isomerase